MTSKILIERTKEVKKIEKEVKLLNDLRKIMCELEKMDYNTMQEILKCKFADDIWYTVEDKIKELENTKEIKIKSLSYTEV